METQQLRLMTEKRLRNSLMVDDQMVHGITKVHVVLQKMILVSSGKGHLRVKSIQYLGKAC
jgi:hypothetical protein